MALNVMYFGSNILLTSESLKYFQMASANNFDDLKGEDEQPFQESPFSIEESLFDKTIGFIEDILVDDNFLNLQNEILEKYWQEFDDTEENKFCYTTIFEEYVSKIEQYIENKLKEVNPEFDMSVLFDELLNRRGELEGEVFEMLYTLSDFVAFKEMMLNYKNYKEGRLPDPSLFMTVTPVLLDLNS